MCICINKCDKTNIKNTNIISKGVSNGVSNGDKMIIWIVKKRATY